MNERADMMRTRLLNLPLRQKIAQMLMIGFRGLSIDSGSTIHADLVQRGIGGVVLFDVDVATQSKPRNIQSPQQLAGLTSQLQACAAIPLIIAVDQEGGQVARLKPEDGFPATLSHRRLGDDNCLAVARAKTLEMAQTLATCGINLNFAPCVDVNLNPQNPVIAAKERSFSHDPTIVVSQAIEFIKAHHQMGVLCTLKHFPGHGSSKADSHLGFVDVTHSWWPDEMLPYEKLITLGLADAVMTAHVFNATLDAAYPATLSKQIINNMLRGALGFNGLVFTDDLHMHAITAHFGLEDAIEKAVNAGADVLLFGNNLTYDERIAEKGISLIERLVDGGRVSEARIDASMLRLASFKSKF